jgi:hypothetical protein
MQRDGQATAWRWTEEGTSWMDVAARDPSGPATYLIVLRHVLVAQDIAMTIAEFDPAAQVILTDSAAEAVERLSGVDRLAVAFVGQGPEAFRASPLSQTVARKGGRVVLMGEEAEAHGEAQGFAVLTRPFSTGSILVHLSARAR